MGPDVPLDTILKKFTIVYSNVKSFDPLMRDFYRADQKEEESIHSFATRMEGLLFQIRDKFPEKFTHSEEQKLLKDRLFHQCRKTVRDSVKYCFSDPQVDYMQFLEECKKVDTSSTKLILWWAKSKPWCQLLKPQGLLPEGLPQLEQECLRLHGEEVQGGIPLEPLPNIGPETPRYLKGLVQITDVGSVEKWGT